jgi:hypothetical protein
MTSDDAQNSIQAIVRKALPSAGLSHLPMERVEALAVLGRADLASDGMLDTAHIAE